MKSMFLLLAFFLLTSNCAFAQEEVERISLMKFSLYGGASLPQGDFGSTSGQKAGYGKSGFCAMIEGSKILSPNIFWSSSVSLSVNSLDETEIQKQLGGIPVSAGRYVTTWIMTGLKFGAPTSENAGIYGIGQIGILFSSFPDITLSYMDQSITQTTKPAAAFAYGFGAGVQFDKINIGLRYYTGEPEYKQSASSGEYSGSAKVSLPATLLQLMLGISL